MNDGSGWLLHIKLWHRKWIRRIWMAEYSRYMLIPMEHCSLAARYSRTDYKSITWSIVPQ